MIQQDVVLGCGGPALGALSCVGASPGGSLETCSSPGGGSSEAWEAPQS